MLRDKLINLISDILSIDKTFIFEEANISLLCILSSYLDELDVEDFKKVEINLDGLKKDTLENAIYNEHYVFADLGFLFESKEQKSIIYKNSRDCLAFFNYEILEVLLILEIESNFDIQIPDEDWCNILTVCQALNAIKDTIKNNVTHKQFKLKI